MKRALLSLFRLLATAPWFGGKLATVARHVVIANRGGSGDPRRNGEHELIRRVVSAHHESRPLIVFDAGANVGDWTAFVLAVAPPDVRVHCFEPATSTFAELERRFRGDPRVLFSRVGLSASSGRADLRVYGVSSGLSSLVPSEFHAGRGDSHLESVATVAGDAYCEAAGVGVIDLLKIDTEGFEWDVLKGFQRMLGEQRIRVVQFEYGYIQSTTGHLMRHFFELLEGFGYLVGPVRPRGPEFRSLRHSDNDFDSGPNYVAALPELLPALGVDPRR